MPFALDECASRKTPQRVKKRGESKTQDHAPRDQTAQLDTAAQGAKGVRRDGEWARTRAAQANLASRRAAMAADERLIARMEGRKGQGRKESPKQNERNCA